MHLFADNGHRFGLGLDLVVDGRENGPANSLVRFVGAGSRNAVDDEVALKLLTEITDLAHGSPQILGGGSGVSPDG
ncbi:hypothetical protein D3C87_1948400 [compost metagenome]